MFLKDKIIPVYQSIFEPLLMTELPDEVIATCDSCTQCRSVESPYINTKCCSYHPHLANYLVGGILQDSTESMETGRAKVQEQLKNRFGVTPYGIIPPYPFFLRIKEFKSHEFWSRPKELNEAQLCPYYSIGYCSIWPYRENLCSTYFCSSIGGKYGKKFWDMFNQYIKMTETTLSQYALFQMDWPPDKIKTEPVTTIDFNFEDENGNLNEEHYRKLWGEWVDREEDFFINCYEKVKDLDIKTFYKLTGLKREILEAALNKLRPKFFENVLPEYMQFNRSVILEDMGNGKIKLILGNVSTIVPAVIMPLVRSFNNKRSTLEAFQLGYDVLYNLSELVDDLREKGMLVKA